ncbi:B12-binding domain-containing radical SAM protein [Parvicella tangerina]|uniref:Anaerobic magnesium-protoporphyrin IX monomethyl ester cyclase n=1 Tax=Parvicella tangerina TaxID=2829795 RepID=A0A916JJ45_9FLAO|nr:radical SAM protein [Parvicella tangerina]CAG5076334.1 Anaerobic magnesium-protoporphyrin IX monomethyl ester cyclase [Parvicella tangerina]
MSVLLTHAYYLEEDEKEANIMKPYVPLGILYISAYLKENNFKTKVFDTTFSSYDKQQKELLATRPKVIAIYTNLVTKLNVIRLINWIKSQPSLSQSKVVLGGPDLRYNIDNYLKTGADFLVIGEGEQTMKELCDHLLTNTDSDLSEVQGLAYLQDGNVVQTPERIKIKDINELPFPDRSAIDLNKYQETWKTHHGMSMLSISTQRGCPYTCKWCSTAVYGMSYRRRSAKLVADEVEMLLKEYQPNAFWFVDDVFTVSHKWIDAFHHEVLSRGLKFNFECITRAERLTDKVLDQLKEMGCSKIWIGAESGSQQIIDEMDRRVDIDLVAETIIKTKEKGIGTGTFIMLGYPTETIIDIENTVKYLSKCNPDDFTITLTYPIKGTSLYEQVKPKITSDLDWFSSTDRDIDFTRTYSRRFYDHAIRYVVNSVKFNQTKSPKHKLKAIYSKTMMNTLK